MLWMALCAALMVIMSALLKQLTHELPVMVVLFFRMLLALPLILPWVGRGGIAFLRTRRMPGHFVRSVAGAVSMWCWVYAVSGMPLADFIAMSFTRPLWMPLTAWVMLGEIVGYRRAGMIALGFLGVLIAVRPQYQTIDTAVLVALFGGVMSSLTMVQVKQLGTTEPSARIVFYFSAYGTLFTAPFAAFEWVTPTLLQLVLLAAMAFFAAFSKYCIARACETGDATVISPVEFLQLPLAAAVGLLIFSEQPDVLVFVGSLLILAATIGIARSA